MFKSKCVYISLVLYGIFCAPFNASATTWISAEGFYSMYRLAATGNVAALKASDLPIDGVNRDEDTGLCYAARRRNAIAWNAYLDAGANPNPECAGRVPGYREFAERSRVITTTTISSTPILYGLGAAALIGGGIALAAGGGGGGGGSGGDEKDCSAYPYDSCPTGYHEIDHCTSGGVTKYKCEINDCSDYPYTGCGTGYHEVDHCQEGDVTKYKCEPDACTDYPYTTCPENTHITGTCMSGDTPKYKCEPYNNYNNPDVGGVSSGNTMTLTKTNTDNENVIVLEYITDGDKVGVRTTLYNGYYKTDDDNPANVDKTWTINVTNTGSGETTGMSNSAGNETIHLYVDGTDVALNATYSAATNITASGEGGNVYGIYSKGNVTTLGAVNDTNATFSSDITINSSGLNKTIYGIYSLANASNNLLSSAASSSSAITINQTHTNSTSRIYGINSATGASNEGTITINNDGFGAVYGIKNSSGSVINSGTIEANNTNAGALGYGIENTEGSVTNSGTITASTIGISSPTVVNSGKIEIENIATSAQPQLYGIYGSNVINTGKKNAEYPEQNKGIYVTLAYSETPTTTSDRFVAGIYGSSATSNTITNQGEISVGIEDDQDGDAKAYGIYNQGDSSVVLNDTDGIIEVSSITAVGPGRSRILYGIYSTGGTVTNKGLIDLAATSGPGEDTATMYGIYTTSGTVVNEGTITIQYDHTCIGEACKDASTGMDNAAYIYTEAGATVNNSGLMTSASPLSMNGHVLLSQGGSFEAPLISGNLGVASDVVSQGFENTYTLRDAIISNDVSDLNINSQSALFEANLQGRDVVLDKKDFAQVLDNPAFANFLEQNYQLKNNEQLFSALKEQVNQASLNASVKDLMGESLTRFAFEDMTMLKELSLDMNEKMFANNKAEFTLTGTTQPINFEKNLGSRSKWALSGKKVGNVSYAIGVAFTNIKSQDGSKDNNRKDEMFQMMMPVGYQTHGFELISTPRLGYAYGHYTRDGYASRDYDGKVEKQIFGVTNALRYPLNLKGWKLSPTAEFNAIGYYIKGHEEEKAFALDIKKQNIWSVEGGVGFNLGKEFDLGKGKNFKFDSTVMFYHEFADPYELKLSMHDMDGTFKIRDEKRRDERIMLKNGFEYHFEPFSIYGDIFSYIDSEYKTKADIGLKYRF